MAAGRQRDVLPLPTPYPTVGVDRWANASKTMRRRLARRNHWQRWCNDGVVSLNELACGSLPTDMASCSSSSSSRVVQNETLARLGEAYKAMDRPPPDLFPARAFFELCSAACPRADSGKGPIPYGSAPVALPDGDALVADVEELLSAEHDSHFLGASLILNSDD